MPTNSTKSTKPTIKLSGKNATGIRADALVVALTGPEVEVVPGTLAGDAAKRLAAVARRLELTGKADEVRTIPAPSGLAADLLVFTGAGEDPGPEALRRAVGAAVATLASAELVVVAAPGARSGNKAGKDDLASVAACAEGALFGAYRYIDYLGSGKDSAKTGPAGLIIATGLAKDPQAKAALDRAVIVAQAVNGTRDLVNCPPNDLYPAKFAELAGTLAAQHGVKVSVTDDKALRSGGYGGLTAVGQGSSRGPRLVRLEYSPSGRRGRKQAALPHVALVGKGITFDSGGLSIKPADSMKTMKLDMAGAAAVLHTVVAAARLGLAVKVTGWLCLAENMPSATAQRPSDVITVFGGKTVEVLNTDAEGRLVLADGLVSASAEQPDAIVDIATLTGAQMVALGNRVSGVMANDDDLRAELVVAADGSGEQFWPMPLPSELRASMDSAVADIANIGDRYGGMLVAGLFLAEFVGDKEDGGKLPWAHLDIAGPSFNESGRHGYTPKGGTGVGVRTMLAVLESRAAGAS